ncbi:MAG: 4Fe-4S dicluster domain-containing protein, partial [Pseudomonadota bacterium]
DNGLSKVLDIYLPDMEQINPDVLIKLIDHLDAYPVGLPDAPEIREFFSIFLTPDEALLASSFPFKEVTAKELATRLGWDEDKTSQTLEALAEKGTVVDFEISDKGRFFLLTPSIVGFIEFSLMKMRSGVPMKRMAEIIESYEKNHLWKEVLASQTAISRAIVGYDIPVTSKVIPLNEVEKLIQKNNGGTVQTCYCRHKKHLLGKSCSVANHLETCFTVDKMGADFLERRGFGKRIGAEEMIERVRALGKLGLIHVTDNIRDNPSFICNCCGCCCGLLATINEKLPKSAVAPTNFILNVENANCVGCGLCAKKCQIHALTIKDGKAICDESICLGCGSCLKFCPKKALSFKKRKKKDSPPNNVITKNIRVAWEKEKFWKLLWEVLKARLP